jgi:hypothetical protein
MYTLQWKYGPVAWHSDGFYSGSKQEIRVRKNRAPKYIYYNGKLCRISYRISTDAR